MCLQYMNVVCSTGDDGEKSHVKTALIDEEGLY